VQSRNVLKLAVATRCGRCSITVHDCNRARNSIRNQRPGTGFAHQDKNGEGNSIQDRVPNTGGFLIGCAFPSNHRWLRVYL
jgi:hypothetical protein